MSDKLKDANVQANIDMLRNRSEVGLKKYGIETSNAGLSAVQWMDHTIEELLDGANYLQACKRQVLAMRTVISDDATAMTFQSMGAYRQYLLKRFDTLAATHPASSTAAKGE